MNHENIFQQLVLLTNISELDILFYENVFPTKRRCRSRNRRPEPNTNGPPDPQFDEVWTALLCIICT